MSASDIRYNLEVKMSVIDKKKKKKTFEKWELLIPALKLVIRKIISYKSQLFC